jgi:hypothetical protein
MDPLTPPPIPATQKRGWWTRNWKWFVPTGCLTFLAIGAAFFFGIMMLVFGAMKSSDAYKTAVTRAKADPRVVSALGSPISEGLFVTGNTNVNPASGQADLSIPISGPKGKGTIYVTAAKSAGVWSYSQLVVAVEKTGERITLIDQTLPKEPDSP